MKKIIKRDLPKRDSITEELKDDLARYHLHKFPNYIFRYLYLKLWNRLNGRYEVTEIESHEVFIITKFVKPLTASFNPTPELVSDDYFETIVLNEPIIIDSQITYIKSK